MAYRYCLIIVMLAGCATQHRPEYHTMTEFYPDCANRDSQIRYMHKLKSLPVKSGDDKVLYDKTLNVQIERLVFYCQ